MFTTFTSGILASLLVSMIAYIISERLLPTVESEDSIKNNKTISDNEKVEWLARYKKRKSFWTIAIALSAFLIGLTISLILKVSDDVSKVDDHVSKIEAELDQINSNYRQIEDPESQKAFKELYSAYVTKYLSSNSRLTSSKWSLEIAEWTKNDIENLTSEIVDGKVELLSHRISEALVPLYNKAEHGIVASNLGGTKAFFKPAYLKANKELYSRGVPLIRFFIYSNKVPMELLKSTNADTISFENYLTEVKHIHEKSKCLISIVIDYDKITKEQDQKLIRKDMMIVDQEIKAEAELTEQSWELLNETLTNNKKYIEEGLRSFQKMGEFTNCEVDTIFQMNEDEILQSYSRFIEKNNIEGENLALEILYHLLEY